MKSMKQYLPIPLHERIKLPISFIKKYEKIYENVVSCNNLVTTTFIPGYY